MKHIKLFEQFIKEQKEESYRVVIRKISPQDSEKMKDEISKLELEDVNVKITGDDKEKTIFISGADKSALSKAKPAITKFASKGEVSTEEKNNDKWETVTSSEDKEDEEGFELKDDDAADDKHSWGGFYPSQVASKFMDDYDDDADGDDLDNWLDMFGYDNKIEAGIKSDFAKSLAKILAGKGYKIKADDIRTV